MIEGVIGGVTNEGVVTVAAVEEVVMGHESGLVIVSRPEGGEGREEEGKVEEGKGEEEEGKEEGVVVIHHNHNHTIIYTTTTAVAVVVVVVIIHHTDQDRSTLITNHPHPTVVTVNSMVMRTHRAQG